MQAYNVIYSEHDTHQFSDPLRPANAVAKECRKSSANVSRPYIYRDVQFRQEAGRLGGWEAGRHGVVLDGKQELNSIVERVIADHSCVDGCAAETLNHAVAS